MNADMLLVGGLLIAGLALPSILSSYADRRSLRIAIIMLLLGGGLVLVAMNTKPGGYTLREVPRAFYSVLADFLS